MPGNAMVYAQEESPKLPLLCSVAWAAGVQEPPVALGVALGLRGSLSYLYETVLPATPEDLVWSVPKGDMPSVTHVFACVAWRGCLLWSLPLATISWSPGRNCLKLTPL